MTTISMDVDTTVTVEVDLSDIDTDDLLEELADRRVATTIELLNELRSMLLSGETHNAIVLIERELTPPKDISAAYTKWRSTK